MTTSGQSERPRLGLGALTIVVVGLVGFGWYVVFDGWQHGLGTGIAATAVWGIFTVGILAALWQMWTEGGW